MHQGEYSMFFGGGFMWIVWIVILLVIIGLVKVFLNQPVQHKTETSALEILQQRYARGEIDKEEYEQRKKDLENG